MFVRIATFAVMLSAIAAPVSAAPRDEALRHAPDNFALVVVVQNLRDHAKNLRESPFAAWFPNSALAKQLPAIDVLKDFADNANPIFELLGTTPKEVFDDVIGDAVIFAYTPAPANQPNGERSVIVLRPRKPETLSKVIDRLNEAQTKSGEVKAVVERKHANAIYYERQKPENASHFYYLHDGVVVFTESEAEIQAAIDRAKAQPKDKPSALATRLQKLGVTDAAVAVLVNPRPLDGEFAAKLKDAKPDEQKVLAKFAEVWKATDNAALYLTLNNTAEIGVSLTFAPDKLPAYAKPWLVGERTASALWSRVPDNAILAVAGRTRTADILELLTALTPKDAKHGVRETLEHTLGPIVGKDKLPRVLDSLGPDWAIWMTPPAKETKDELPAVVAAVKVQAEDPKTGDTAKTLLQTLEYGFQVIRVNYNAKHTEQMELREEKVGDVVVKSLVCDAFPAGFRPCFAFKDGYLLLSTSPQSIQAFQAPKDAPRPGGEVPFARLNAVAAREYLSASAPKLAKLLSTTTGGDETSIADQLANLLVILETLDKVEVLTHTHDSGVKLMFRVTPVKPLK
jgi:hypothetical protein